MPRDLKEAMLFIWFYNGFFSRAIGQRAVLPLFERLSQALAKDCGHIWRYGAHDGIIDVSLWPAF